MIEIPRALVRQFRAVLRRSLLDQEPRGSWPLVLCRTGKEGLVLQACQGDLAVRYRLPGERPPEAIAFRASAFAQFEGRRDDPVVLEQVAFGKGQARWTDGSVPRVLDLETVVPESAPEFPALPKQFIPMPAGFLHALDEAVKTTARESVRFALGRLQLRGKAGEVVATDGRQLLVQGGFPLPWSDAVLVPRVPAFGIRGLAEEGEVAVGRTKSHVAVKAGPWSFLLAIDAKSRFPDVDTVIPRTSALAARLKVEPQDAQLLIANLPRLPGGDDDHGPVTLDLGTSVVVRARGDGREKAAELVLARSHATGKPARLCTNRSFLRRALQLGFTELQVNSSDQPIVCRDGQRVYVWMTLGAEPTIPPSPDPTRTVSPDNLSPPAPLRTERRNADMAAPRTNGHETDNGKPDGNTDPERWGIAEAVAETEALRGLLQDAAARATRLLAALKHQRRRSRAVQQAVRSLKELQLDR